MFKGEIFYGMIMVLATTAGVSVAESIPQWGVFETAVRGPADGNPFVDVTLSAHFTSGKTAIDVPGFYDGDGVYRIRFMPPQQGLWQFVTHGNRPELDGKTGQFTCTAPTADDHGPVGVKNTYHFAYADGTPFVPLGTTSYNWVHQPDPIEDRTLASLKQSPFNKLRMCLLPNRPAGGGTDPIYFPFVQTAQTTSPTGTKLRQWDFDRFNVDFFRHIDRRIADLNGLGVQADLILFHSYDRAADSYEQMGPAASDRYLRYVVARLSAYRNIWWSIANEFDLIKTRTDADWDRYFQVIHDADPYGHLRSVHYSRRMYNPDKPWVTHLSVQDGMALSDFGRGYIYRDVGRKPVVFDEVRYEGNMERRWGQLSGEDMTLRFWMGTIAGTYVTHGEVLAGNDNLSWGSRGGELHGTSVPRIAFLKQILATAPPDGLEQIDRYYESHIGGKAGEYYLIYFGTERPTAWNFALPRDGLVKGMEFKVDVLDTWNMTVTPIDQVFKLDSTSYYFFGPTPAYQVQLPGRPYMALRIRRADTIK